MSTTVDATAIATTDRPHPMPEVDGNARAPVVGHDVAEAPRESGMARPATGMAHRRPGENLTEHESRRERGQTAQSKRRPRGQIELSTAAR
jgi:hypothetical protein